MAAGLRAAFALALRAIHPSVSRVVPYFLKWWDAGMARVFAAEPTPNGAIHCDWPDTRALPPAMPFAVAPPEVGPAARSAAYVACHTVRKHSTWRHSPAATAIIAATTEPAGPNVSGPPLYHVGRRRSVSSSALTPPSEKPPPGAPAG